MDQDNARAMGQEDRVLARKSWTAYVRIMLAGLLGLLIIVPLAWQASWGLDLVALLGVLGVLVYKVLDTRSHLFYVNDVGVWHARGILPWNKGVAGVKWRDLDEAVFFQGMGSWLLKSYTVRIGHRFTKANEIVMTHMAGGHQAVMTVNAMHQDLVRHGRLS